VLLRSLCVLYPPPPPPAQLRRRLAADPTDIEAQRTLEAMITRDNVTTNRDLAYEHMPEAFMRCVRTGAQIEFCVW
jgi:hypothetical protein